VAELARLHTVVCVAVDENYVLERVEAQGIAGPEKYALAGITFTVPPDW
jgi:hypothetical protein